MEEETEPGAVFESGMDLVGVCAAVFDNDEDTDPDVDNVSV